MESVHANNSVLEPLAIKHKIKRMALEIAEQNAEETELVIAAINGNGEVVAAKLKEQLQAIVPFQLQSLKININKRDPINVSIEPEVNCDNKVILIVDDVANSGKTIMYALKSFLSQRPKKIQTVVLVERSHKLFPIQTDYSGLSIATTLQEHIAVETRDGEIEGAWLY